MPLVNNTWKEASGQKKHKDCCFPWAGTSFAAYLSIKLSQDLLIVKGRMVEIHTHTKKNKKSGISDFSGNIWQYSMHEEKLLYSDFLTALLCGSQIICQRVWSQKQRLHWITQRMNISQSASANYMLNFLLACSLLWREISP